MTSLSRRAFFGVQNIHQNLGVSKNSGGSIENWDHFFWGESNNTNHKSMAILRDFLWITMHCLGWLSYNDAWRCDLRAPPKNRKESDGWYEAHLRLAEMHNFTTGQASCVSWMPAWEFQDNCAVEKAICSVDDVGSWWCNISVNKLPVYKGLKRTALECFIDFFKRYVEGW